MACHNPKYPSRYLEPSVSFPSWNTFEGFVDNNFIKEGNPLRATKAFTLSETEVATFDSVSAQYERRRSRMSQERLVIGFVFRKRVLLVHVKPAAL